MSAVRTGLLIGGPCDGQAVRVMIGQPSVLIPFRAKGLLQPTMMFDPATPDADTHFRVARYSNERIGGLPESTFEFFVFREVER